MTVALVSPSLWAPDHPVLYTLRSTVEVAGILSDNATTRFGVRKVRHPPLAGNPRSLCFPPSEYCKALHPTPLQAVFDPNQGLLLNGVHTIMKGFCQHADVAGMGAALTQPVQARRRGRGGLRAHLLALR